MDDLIERARLGDYAPGGPTRLDIVNDYLRTFLAAPIERESGSSVPIWHLALEHAEDGGVHVVAEMCDGLRSGKPDTQNPGKAEEIPEVLGRFEHTFPPSCFADADGLAVEACKMLPEAYVVRRWKLAVEVHTVPTTPKEAQRIKAKIELHAGKVRGVEFAFTEIGEA